MSQPFAIIQYNCRTYESGGVVAVVPGKAAAQELLQSLERGQNEEDRYAGWRYFIEQSDLAPGTDAQQATKLRQIRLDRQDSEA